jgi:hypothetical protein
MRVRAASAAEAANDRRYEQDGSEALVLVGVIDICNGAVKGA